LLCALRLGFEKWSDVSETTESINEMLAEMMRRAEGDDLATPNALRTLRDLHEQSAKLGTLDVVASRRAIAARTGISDKRVRGALRRLEQLGYLRRLSESEAPARYNAKGSRPLNVVRLVTLGPYEDVGPTLGPRWALSTLGSTSEVTSHDVTSHDVTSGEVKSLTAQSSKQRTPERLGGVEEAEGSERSNPPGLSAEELERVREQARRSLDALDAEWLADEAERERTAAERRRERARRRFPSREEQSR
jgi:hypothetical protein